ncbi:putative ATP-dependent helicase C17A2.12 [Exophiala dermatitidis]|uniref:Adenosinetriphosphatase n=1 Tax=Exophiala dermatitidis (strain ATCC 34100 / CBS 525.76 / NIH/UT8656) TaxID=858893 RepID=H6C4C8_EXODN|nr:adenosinetriphosphatase [Exophiala dermatitidis NIH/UT8656]EHY57601.1 adenosinetriphosphatase [Exophiala dermatitidis NIH/UT8656]
MADDMDPARIAEIEDVQDDIAFNIGLLESLNDLEDGQSDTEDSKNVVRNNLAELRKRLYALQPAHEDTSSGGSLYMGLDGSNDHGMPPPSYDLATRKRQRDGRTLRDDRSGPPAKSRRTTPSSSMTTASSPADSTGSLDSLDFDDPSITSLFDLSKEEAARNQEAWRKHEQRRKQEKADARLAQMLSQEADTSNRSTSTPAAGSPPDRTQAFFKSDGSMNRRSGVPNPSSQQSQSTSTSMNRPLPPSTPIRLKPVSTLSRPGAASTRSPSRPGSSTQVTPNSSASNSRPSQPVPPVDGFEPRPPRPYSISTNMPGSFPGTQAYSSVGGTLVYNSPSYVASSATPGSTSSVTFNNSIPTGLSFHQYLVDPAQTKQEVQHLIKHIRPDEEFTANEVAVQPDGITVTMMPHQLYGLTWMKKMEEGTNKGGILADDMGLGKTIQSIALMLARPPADGKRRPTLVVAPVALMHQWKKELEKMVDRAHRLNVFVLHGESRRTTWSALKAYDVVLTTYGLLTTELKRQIAWEEKAKLFENARPTLAEECPVLGERSHFHRVILDEAQWIKNRKAKCAIAACRIQTDYRWALTGTPMQNSVEEMYSLVKFCRIRPYNEWNLFNRDICQPLKKTRDYYGGKAKAMQALQALLRAILLRRNKSSTINGQPILQLPSKTTIEERVTFSEDELTFYKALENRAQIQFNKYIKAGGGGIGKNYAHTLVLLLRLRQACCHPALVVQSKDFLQGAGSLDTDTLLENAAQLNKEVVNRLKDLDAFECPICMDVDENPALFPCGHALCSDCLSRLVEQANNENEARPNCPHCRASIDANKITDVVSFLRVHRPDRAPKETKAGMDDDDDTGSESESDDSDEGGDLGGFIVPDDFTEAEDKKQIIKSRKEKKESDSQDNFKSRDAFKTLAQLRKEGLQNKAAKRKYLRRLRKNFEPSAKITKTVALLEQIKSRGENEQSIIFSNFTSFLDLIEVPLANHPDFRHYVRYDGSMTTKDRNNAVLEFTENPNCNVILVSLRAGNAGLNLTAANHVLMMDPFWNPFVEYQAADRCYRIGQTREVTVHRVLISEHGSEDDQPSANKAGPGSKVTIQPSTVEDGPGFTVEDRILALQEKKRHLVETALSESAGRDVARLSVRELGYLFGLNSM